MSDPALSISSKNEDMLPVKMFTVHQGKWICKPIIAIVLSAIMAQVTKYDKWTQS